MTSRAAGTAGLGLGGVAVVLVRQLQRRTAAGAGRAAEPRAWWRAVTINASTDEVMPENRVPGPLAELGHLVEVEVRPAPNLEEFRIAGAGSSQVAPRLRAALEDLIRDGNSGPDD